MPPFVLSRAQSSLLMFVSTCGLKYRSLLRGLCSPAPESSDPTISSIRGQRPHYVEPHFQALVVNGKKTRSWRWRDKNGAGKSVQSSESSLKGTTLPESGHLAGYTGIDALMAHDQVMP
ncbi:hypothetical protein BGY98DRAFT_970917, partial [Russula aff. rugulosa BPL654]